MNWSIAFHFPIYVHNLNTFLHLDCILHLFFAFFDIFSNNSRMTLPYTSRCVADSPRDPFSSPIFPIFPSFLDDPRFIFLLRVIVHQRVTLRAPLQTILLIWHSVNPTWISYRDLSPQVPPSLETPLSFLFCDNHAMNVLLSFRLTRLSPLTFFHFVTYCLFDLVWLDTHLTTSSVFPRPRRDDTTSTWRRICNIHVSTLPLQCKIKCKVPLVLISSSVTLSVVIPLYSLKFSNVTAQGIESIKNMRIIELKWKW